MRFNARKLGALSAAAIAVGALGTVPSAASAARWDAANDDACETVANVLGRGASFARSAHIGWGANILTPDVFIQTTRVGIGDAFSGRECSEFDQSVTTPLNVVEYAPTGSGSGRAAVGATNIGNQRFTDGTGAALGFTVNFGGADEAPTAGQITNANAGDTGVAYDNATLHTIPVAQGAIAVDVRIPDGCSVTANANAGNRQITRRNLENVYDGTLTRWGQVIANISGTVTGTATACRDQTFEVVVRQDSSGTTFQFKRYLFDIDSTQVVGTGNWNTAPNTTWPAGVTVTRSATAGAGALLDYLSGLTVRGGFGYADVATSRSVRREYGWGASANDASDRRFWLWVERRDGNIRSAALNDLQSTRSLGARCGGVIYNDFAQETDPVRNGAILPSSSTRSWFDVSAVSTTADYPICVLTYAMSFEDQQPVNAGVNRDATRTATPITQAQARSAKDYLWYAVEATCGQAKLAGIDYGALPTATDRNGDTVTARASAGVQAITWAGGANNERPLPTC